MGATAPPAVAERAARQLVVRAAAAALAGGLVVTLVAASFGPRLFLADVRALGIGLGVLAAVLAVGPLVTGRAGSTVGPVLVAAGVLALPVAGGGLVVGSALVIGGGVVLASYDPPPPGATAVTAPAGPLRRTAAAAVDLGLTAALVVVLSANVVGGLLADSAGLVYLLWAVTWALVTLPAALAVGGSPGAWLLGVRLHGPPARRAARQALRGLLAVGALLLVASLGASAGLLPGAVAAAAAIAVLVLSVRGRAGATTWLDVVTRTVPLVLRVRAS